MKCIGSRVRGTPTGLLSDDLGQPSVEETEGNSVIIRAAEADRVAMALVWRVRVEYNE